MENNDYIPDQYKGALEKLNKAIGYVETDIDINGDSMNFFGEYTKRKKISSLFYNFMIQNFQKGINLPDLITITSKIIKAHKKFAFEIIDGFTQGYIDTNKNWEDIGYCIHHIINKNGIKNSQNLVSNIINGFVQGFFKKSNDIGFLIKEIRQIIIANAKSAFEIIDGFTQGCLNKNQTPKDIGISIYNILKDTEIKNYSDLVSSIINGFTQGCIDKNQILEKIGKGISEIIKEDKINRDPDLVSNIFNGFVRGCLERKPDNIKEIAENFSQLLDIDFGEHEAKIKKNLRPTLASIHCEYCNKQLSEKNEETEDRIVDCYKKIFNETDGEKITKFRLRLQRSYQSTNSSNTQLLEKDADYHSLQSYCPPIGITRKPSTKADQEKTGGLNDKSNKLSEPEQNKNSNDRKRKYNSISNSNSEKINESFTDRRHEQQNQQDYRSRYK